MSASGKLMSFGGTATTTETRVAFPQAYRRGYPNANPGAGVQTYPTPQKPPSFMKNLRIRCTDATNDLLIRINGGSQITVKHTDAQPFQFDPGEVHDLTVQSSAATAAWEAVGVVSA